MFFIVFLGVCLKPPKRYNKHTINGICEEAMKLKILTLFALLVSSLSYAELPTANAATAKSESSILRVHGTYFQHECQPFAYEWEAQPIKGYSGEVAAKLTKYDDTPACHKTEYYITFPYGGGSGNRHFTLSGFGGSKALVLAKGFSKSFLKGNPQNLVLPVVHNVVFRVSRQNPAKMQHLDENDPRYRNWDYYDYKTNIYLVSEYFLQSTANTVIDEFAPAEQKWEDAFNPFKDKRPFGNVFDLEKVRNDFIPEDER